jgi:hypothetical protein
MKTLAGLVIPKQREHGDFTSAFEMDQLGIVRGGGPPEVALG